MANLAPKASLLSDWQKLQHNPVARLAIFMVYAGFIAVVGLIPSWLLDWNKLVLAAVLATMATTFLIGVIEALRELEIQRGNSLGAQVLANLEQEVLSWHGVTPEIIASLKQLALNVAPDLLQAAEGKGVQPQIPPNRFPGQPTDIASLMPPSLPSSNRPATPAPTQTSGGAQQLPTVPTNWANQPWPKN